MDARRRLDGVLLEGVDDVDREVDVEDQLIGDLDDSPEVRASTSRRLTNPRLRHVTKTTEADRAARAAGSWWLGKDREAFTEAARERSVALRGSKAAAKVKTPVNFV